MSVHLSRDLILLQKCRTFLNLFIGEDGVLIKKNSRKVDELSKKHTQKKK